MIKRKWAVGFLVVFGLMALSGGGYVFLIHLPSQRAEEAYEKGKEALAAGRLSAAAGWYEEAFDLRPRHPEAGLALFDAIAFFEPQRAATLLEELESLGLPREAILARRIELHLHEGRADEARAVMVELDEIGETGFEADYARLRVLLADGDAEESLRRLNDLVNLYPGNRKVSLLNAQVLYATGNTLNRVRTKIILQGLLNRNDSVSFRAASLLLLMPELPLFAPGLEEAAAHIEEHPYLEQGMQQLEPNDLRRMSVRVAQSDPDAAFLFAQRLAEHPEATDQDKVLYLSVAQAGDNWREAKATLDSLGEKEELSIGESLVLARQDFIEERNVEAISRIRQVLEREPGNSEVLRILRDRASASMEGLTDAQRLEIFQMIREHPGSDPELVLSATSAAIHLLPEQRERLVEEAIASYGESDPVTTGLWLIGLGYPERALEVVSLEQALGSLDGFSVRYEALSAMERYLETGDLIDAAGDLLSDFQANLVRARLAILEEDDGEAASFLRAALDLMDTEFERSRVFNVAAMATEVGAADVMRSAYDKAFTSGMFFPRQHALAYLETLLNDVDLAEAKRFSNYLRTLSPEDPVYINNDCYLDTILEQNLDEAILSMTDLVEENPDVSHFRVTLALAQLLAGYEEAAMSTIDESEVSLDLESPQSKFAFALVLAGSGQRGMARNLLDSIDRDALLQVERQLLDRFLFSSE